MKHIDKGTRLANYLIDLIVIYSLWFVVVLMSQFYNAEYLIFYILMFLYYLIFETITGQTLGKMVTKTKVITKDGTRPTFVNIRIRTLSRLIPFDALS
ncbi:RDD family protein [Psychroserpens mesophilus]|uniref:RDD family protein n=1 Tax=Psychroserpens mesophilus TaxID=325473 RepID=UPI001362C6B7|nr:RDD family protein [Psychroserpens mesophilus]